MRFSKMHGAGNDFVVLDLRDGVPPPDAALARLLGDRRKGVGCDQILTIEPPRSAGAVAAYGIWNSDGSSAIQCGNGARCVAAWLVRDGTARGGRFVVDSPAGTHAVDALGDGMYRIEMGLPVFEPARIPLHGFAAAQDEYALEVAGRTVRFAALAVGNPHAVVEVDDVDFAPVEAVGPALQRHAAFPASVNVGFAQVQSRQRIRLRVFERGTGETLACGTGACAAVAIGRVWDALDETVNVDLPGGRLVISWSGDDRDPVWMTGPAVEVFQGDYA